MPGFVAPSSADAWISSPSGVALVANLYSFVPYVLSSHTSANQRRTIVSVSTPWAISAAAYCWKISEVFVPSKRAAHTASTAPSGVQLSAVFAAASALARSWPASAACCSAVAWLSAAVCWACSALSLAAWAAVWLAAACFWAVSAAALEAAALLAAVSVWPFSALQSARVCSSSAWSASAASAFFVASAALFVASWAFLIAAWVFVSRLPSAVWRAVSAFVRAVSAFAREVSALFRALSAFSLAVSAFTRTFSAFTRFCSASARRRSTVAHSSMSALISAHLVSKAVISLEDRIAASLRLLWPTFTVKVQEVKIWLLSFARISTSQTTSPGTASTWFVSSTKMRLPSSIFAAL